MSDVINQSQNQQCDPVNFTFTNPELILHIIQPLIDVKSLPDLISLSTVSSDFSQIIKTSESFWKELCRQRWKTKWGFHRRWESAIEDFHLFNQYEENRNSSGITSFWRERYFEEEQDATRRSIGLRELNSLKFDFRFWIGQPTVIGERIVVRSGLLQSASRDVRFQSDENDNNWERNEDFLYRGTLSGHPCQEPGIEWFMNDSSIIQWGFSPNLWPRGEIRRTPDWGWEIRNPNVVMRAIDPLPSTDVDEEKEESDQDYADNSLWEDLINSLENVPMRNAPEVNGYPVTAELPRSFLDHPFVD